MSDSRFFCAAEARQRNELIFGTAARVDTWLLLETPGAWSARALPTEHLPRRVDAHYERLAKSIPRSRRLLIRQRYSGHSDYRFFAVDSRGDMRTRAFSLGSYEELLDLDAGGLSGDSGSDSAKAVEYLVCTHGRHDKCCAKFGFATYCAFKDLCGESAWQCSHVGGDRFASNVVFLPYGIYYGHVMQEEVPALVEAGRRGNVSLAHYRGRSTFGRAAQVADYLLRKETGILGLDALTLARSDQVGDARWRVQFRDAKGPGGHEIEFAARAAAFVELLTCHASDAAPVTQYELVSYRRLDG